MDRLNKEPWFYLLSKHSKNFVLPLDREHYQYSSILSDASCEEFSFPYLFPKEKFWYKVDTEFTLSPVKYVKQWLVNYTQLFASDPGCMFFFISSNNKN